MLSHFSCEPLDEGKLISAFKSFLAGTHILADNVVFGEGIYEEGVWSGVVECLVRLWRRGGDKAGWKLGVLMVEMGG